MSASRKRRTGSAPISPTNPASIALYPDAFTKTGGKPVRYTSFAELAAFFSRSPRQIEDKRRATFFTRGVVVAEPLKKVDVVGPFLVMLDIDEDELPPAACSDRLALFGVNHVLHTTHSQGSPDKSGHSYRVFVDLVASSWWELEGVTKQLFDLVGLEERRESWQTLGYFVPSVHPTRTKGYRFREVLNAGGWKPEPVTKPEKPEAGSLDASNVGAGIDDLAKLEAALGFIDSDERDVWYSVGMALHASGDTRAYDVWYEWSSTSAKCDPEDSARVWASFTDEKAEAGGLTLGSVYHWATEAGYVMPTLSAEMKASHNDAFDDFDDVEPPTEDEEADADPRLAKLHVMNRRHAFVGIGQGVVADLGDGTDAIRLMSKSAFLGVYQRPKFTVGSGKNEQVLSAGQYWLGEWPKRRTYYRTDFLPTGSPEALSDEVLNSWRGWKYENVEPGPFDLWQTLTRDVICRGDDELYRWVVAWCATLVQRPYEKPGTAIVMRSGEGTGKGTFGRALTELCGVHGIQVTHAKHLTGNFNAHLDSKVLLFGDEVTWGGRKTEEAVLKSLITEETETRERKGIDAFQSRSCLHVMLATNERWAVPAGPDARRFLVLDTLPFQGPDGVARRVFCISVRDQLAANGGAGFSGLLRWLRGLDLDSDEWPDPRSVIKTEALQEQKIRSLDPVGQAVHAALVQGYWSISPPDDLEEVERHGWPEIVPVDLVFDFYLGIAKELGTPRREGREIFGKRLREMLGRVDMVRPREEDGTRVRAYRFRSLAEARASFEAFLAAPIKWGDEAEEG